MLVFVCLEKPQAASSFPLANLPHSDIILWQDYEHDEKDMIYQLSYLVPPFSPRFPPPVVWP